MRKVKFRKNIKISKVILLVVTLIFFFTIIFLKIYSNKSSESILEISKIKYKELLQSYLSNDIGYNILNNKDLGNVLVINKNDTGEILYVDYDLDKAYNILDIVTKRLYEKVNDLENGININDKDFINGKNKIALKVPLFFANKNVFLSNLGPKVYVPLNFVGSILTNIKSKITNYGLNNALVELYITISMSANIITPLEKETLIIDYDVLVASTVINGRVPEIYGGSILKESSVFSIPFE